MSAPDLDGRIALITGAAGGIGQALARAFVGAGLRVALCDTSEDGVRRLHGELGADRTLALPLDVSDPTACRDSVARTIARFGRLDVLVNNAGVYKFVPLDQITPEEFHRQFDINVLGTLLATKEAAKHFGPEGGSVINLSSVVSQNAIATASIYSATKAGIIGMARTWALELAPFGITVNVVAPGPIGDTEMFESVMSPESERARKLAQSIPLGRLGKSSDVARAVTFFSSPDAL